MFDFLWKTAHIPKEIEKIWVCVHWYVDARIKYVEEEGKWVEFQPKEYSFEKTFEGDKAKSLGASYWYDSKECKVVEDDIIKVPTTLGIFLKSEPEKQIFFTSFPDLETVTVIKDWKKNTKTETVIFNHPESTVDVVHFSSGLDSKDIGINYTELDFDGSENLEKYTFHWNGMQQYERGKFKKGYLDGQGYEVRQFPETYLEQRFEGEYSKGNLNGLGKCSHAMFSALSPNYMLKYTSQIGTFVDARGVGKTFRIEQFNDIYTIEQCFLTKDMERYGTQLFVLQDSYGNRKVVKHQAKDAPETEMGDGVVSDGDEEQLRRLLDKYISEE